MSLADKLRASGEQALEAKLRATPDTTNITSPELVAALTFEQWQKGHANGFGKTGFGVIYDLPDLFKEDKANEPSDDELRKAIAFYLNRHANEVPNSEGNILNAAALLLIGEPVPPAYLKVKGDPDTERFYSGEFAGLLYKLFDLFRYSNRVALEKRRSEVAHMIIKGNDLVMPEDVA